MMHYALLLAILRRSHPGRLLPAIRLTFLTKVSLSKSPDTTPDCVIRHPPHTHSSPEPLSALKHTHTSMPRASPHLARRPPLHHAGDERHAVVRGQDTGGAHGQPQLQP
eukprot:1191861-Prorocentrum_minimum.AAC.2